MAYPWRAFENELRSLIVATWPHLVKNGIRDIDEVERISKDAITFPHAVLECSDGEPEEWGLVNDVLGYDVTVHYCGLSTENRFEIREQLERLRDSFFLRDWENATLEECIACSVHPNHPAESIALARNAPQRVGSVTFKFVLGEVAT